MPAALCSRHAPLSACPVASLLLNASHPSASAHNALHSALVKLPPLASYGRFVRSTMFQNGPRNLDRRHSLSAEVPVLVAEEVPVVVAVDVADVVRSHPLHATGHRV